MLNFKGAKTVTLYFSMDITVCLDCRRVLLQHLDYMYTLRTGIMPYLSVHLPFRAQQRVLYLVSSQFFTEVTRLVVGKTELYSQLYLF
jgi:hypothetical protein